MSRSNAPTPATAAPKRRKWRRRLLWLGVIAVVARIGLAVGAAPTLRYVAGMFDLECEVQSIEFDVLAGEARIYGLRLWHDDADSSAPLLELEYAGVDVATLELLRAELIVRRVEADGLDLYVARDEFARWNIAPVIQPFLTEQAATASEELAETQRKHTGPLQFDLPFTIEALRGTHLRLHLDDALADPPLDTTITAIVRLSDLGHDERVTRLSVAAAGPLVLDVFDLKADAAVAGAEIDASIDVRMRGLHPRPLAGYLELIGLAPSADRLDADLHVELDATATDAGGNHFALAVSEAKWSVDSAESLALDSWKTALGMEPGPRLHVEPIEIDGARAATERDAEGRFAAAGFTFIGMQDASTSAPAPQDDVAVETEEDAPKDAGTRLVDLLPFALQVDGLRATNCEVRFTDRVQSPEQEFMIALDGFQVSTLDSSVPEQPTAYSANLRAPGSLGSIMSQGALAPFAAGPSIEAELHSEGADLAKLDPYLEALGLESDWTDGRFSAFFHARGTALEDGNWSLDFGVDDVRLAEGESETPWFALANASADGLVIDSANRRIVLEQARLAGVRSAVQRLADGGWSALGVRTRARAGGTVIIDDGAPAATGDAPAPAPEPLADIPAQRTGTTLSPWRLEVGRLDFEDTDLRFRDDAISPVVEFRFDDLGASVEELAMGGGSDSAAGRARVNAFLRQPGLADSLELTGDLTSEPGVLGLNWQLELTGSGLAPTALKPYLDAANIEVVDATSALAARLDGSMLLDDGALELEARVSDFALGPVDAPFLSADEFELGGLRVSPDLVRVEALTFTRPLLRLERRADGALLVAGLRIGGDEPEAPDTGETPATDVVEGDVGPAQPRVEVHVTDNGPSDPFAALDALAMQFELGHFGLDEARLVWRDEAVDPVLDTVILCRTTVDGLALRPGAADAAFTIEWRVEGEEKSTRIAGNVVLDPRAIELDGQVIADHLDFERLSVYFPPGIRSNSENARFQASFHAALTAIEAGGRALLVECTDLQLTDGIAEEPALALASARFSAPRLDGTAGVFEIAEVTTSGIELRLHRDMQSRWHALGLVIDPSAKSPDVELDANLPPLPEVRTVSRQPVAADSDLPTIRLGTVDVGIDRLILTDEFQGEGAEPLVVEMRASTSEPQVLMSEDPANLPPFALRLSARVSPLIDELAAELTVAPFAPQPSAKGTLSMRGLDGHGVIELLPQLAEAIDTAGLPAGEFDGSFELTLDARRRGLTRFEFKRGFGVDLLASDLAFRAEPGGEVLLGLESLEVSAPRINAALQEIVVQRIEIVEPRARFARDVRGVHALGLVIDPVALQAALDASRAPETGDGEVAANSPPPTGAPRTSRGELRIDELLVSGVDFDFKDESYSPPLHVPLTGLSLEISRFTTRGFVEKLPVRFNTYVEAGDVELGEGFEPAPFFSEATVSGQVSFYPALEGWVDAGLSELALRSLRGPAGASGVTIGDGSMDGSVRVRLRGERGMTIDAKSTFRDLSVSEPSDGPISRYLGIAMPLESALFALRNTDGEVVLAPPSIKISSSGVSAAEITRVATTAIAKEITLAVARAPLRMTKGVADAAGALTENIPLVGGVTGGIFSGVSGLFGGRSGEPLPEIGSIDFLPGDVNVMPDQQAKLDEAIRRLRDDKKRVIVLIHEFTTADLERAQELANPSVEDCRELVAGLRQKKAELYRIRDEVTAEARARILTGQEEQARLSIERLRVIDGELGRTEVSIDETLELLQPGAERRRDKRGRKAAMTIAEARLEQIVTSLRDAGISKLDQRLEVRRPRPRPVETEDQAAQGGRIKLGVR